MAKLPGLLLIDPAVEHVILFDLDETCEIG